MLYRRLVYGFLVGAILKVGARLLFIDLAKYAYTWFSFVRETKGRPLEELGEVFNPPPRVYASFAWEELTWYLLWPFLFKHRRAIKSKPPRLEDNDAYKIWKNKSSRETELKDMNGAGSQKGRGSPPGP